jgi:hypothetical protein
LEQHIEQQRAVAVCIGPAGMGPWQDREAEAFISEAVKRDCRVIPVLLDGLTQPPQLPVFLRAHHAVDFRQRDPDPLKQLVWGITGRGW